jgi:ParB family chromosome partitioning protein
VQVKRIAINDIDIVEGRNFREGKITTADLEESLTALGLLHPIQVVTIDGRFVVNAGERRLRAATKLGWEKIDAVVLDDVDEVDVELAAIDENIIRRNLQGASLDRALKRRKELYLHKYPQTAAHVAGGVARAKGDDDSERQKSFAEDTAEKTGKSSRTIERSVRRAERLSPATMKAYESGQITQTQADILAGRPWEEQEQLIEQVSGKSVEETRKIIQGEFPDDRPEPDSTPIKMLETLYMHGQKLVGILEQLTGIGELDPEVVESVLNLQINLNEEFTSFADTVSTAAEAEQSEEEPPAEAPF